VTNFIRKMNNESSYSIIHVTTFALIQSNRYVIAVSAAAVYNYIKNNLL